MDQLVPSRAQESNTAQLLQAALQEEQEDLRFSRPGARPQGSNEALESLFATAAVSACSMSYSMLKLKKKEIKKWEKLLLLKKQLREQQHQ